MKKGGGARSSGSFFYSPFGFNVLVLLGILCLWKMANIPMLGSFDWFGKCCKKAGLFTSLRGSSAVEW